MNRYMSKGKQVSSDKWVIGYLYLCDWKEYTHYIRFQKDWHYVDMAIEPETLCQCTGLKDKNGKLIFEGDICNFKITSGENPKTCFVQYNHGSCGFEPCNMDEWHEDDRKWSSFIMCDDEVWNIDYFEVIGNIHDKEGE